MGALWVIIIAIWTHRESIGQFPLVFLLYPEAFLLPRDFSWTAWSAIGFTLALILGTSVFLFVVYLIDSVLSHVAS